MPVRHHTDNLDPFQPLPGTSSIGARCPASVDLQSSAIGPMESAEIKPTTITSTKKAPKEST
jgi:hypothetical protein